MMTHEEILRSAIDRTERGIRWGHAEQENITDVLKALQSQAGAIPEGMVLVPREITGPMLDAWFSSHGDNRETDNDAFFQPRWKAMLAACEPKKEE